MKDDNCIFCKLANGDIPTNTIYEDADFRVILDASPATKGHALILPKNHAANIYELPDEDAADIFVLAKKLATKMTEILHCDGFNIVQNNGEVAGITGKNLKIEALNVKSNTVKYRVYVQDAGWQEFKQNGEISGTIGKNQERS